MITIYKSKTQKFVENIYFNQDDGFFYIGPFACKTYPQKYSTLKELLEDYKLEFKDLIHLKHRQFRI